MIVLVDGDILAYRVAASKDVYDISSLIEKSEETIDNIRNDVNPYIDNKTFRFYLTGKGNFRYDIDKSYKDNRKQEKPSWLDLARQIFIQKYGAVLSEGQEADDCIAIEASKYDWHDVIVVSTDKDFQQLPCQLFNPGTASRRRDKETGEIVNVPAKPVWTSIDPWSGLVFFYKQLLVGDRVDNVFGVDGVGPVGAEKALKDATTEQELWDICLDLYEGDYDRTLRNARLLWLRRYEGQIWEPPHNRV